MSSYGNNMGPNSGLSRSLSCLGGMNHSGSSLSMSTSSLNMGSSGSMSMGRGSLDNRMDLVSLRMYVCMYEAVHIFTLV